MASKFHLFASILAGALVCPLAGAQMRNGGASFRQAPVHIGRASGAAGSLPSRAPTGSQSRLQPRVVQISPSGQITSEFGPIVNTTDFNGVPGLGFDFPHLAAISAGLRNNRFSHFGRGRRGQGTFAPIWYGGYPYYYDDSGYDQPEQQIVQPSQQQPQIIVIQQPVPAQQGADSVNDAGNLSASFASPQADAPIRDVGDFIFVRRDGRVLFASVFSVVGAQLQYVTPEGIRRTLALSDLDADATRQMNEARGTTVEIHN